MNLTKKFIKENLIKKEDLENIWADLKKEDLAGKYISTERAKKIWNRYCCELNDTILDNCNIDWEKFHSL